jgi:electron transfer flavoprotein alpha/beta subunit
VKIAVCIKRVPDMDVRFKIAASGKAVDESGLKFDISDFDGYAVEAALQIKERRTPAKSSSSRSAEMRCRRRSARR